MATTPTTNYAVGIDLGTTYSCVAVLRNNKVDIISNDQGNRTTPSYVAFTDDERLIGEAAKNQAAMNAPRTVFDAKRLIGRKFEDAEVRRDVKHWPFTVVGGANGQPLIEVAGIGGQNGKARQFKAEEISAMYVHARTALAEIDRRFSLTRPPCCSFSLLAFCRVRTPPHHHCMPRCMPRDAVVLDRVVSSVLASNPRLAQPALHHPKLNRIPWDQLGRSIVSARMRTRRTPSTFATLVPRCVSSRSTSPL
jgi:hypothetical protein